MYPRGTSCGIGVWCRRLLTVQRPEFYTASCEDVGRLPCAVELWAIEIEPEPCGDTIEIRELRVHLVDRGGVHMKCDRVAYWSALPYQVAVLFCERESRRLGKIVERYREGQRSRVTRLDAFVEPRGLSVAFLDRAIPVL